MKFFLILKPGPPNIKIIYFIYYLLQLFIVSISITMIIDGISDPFGDLVVLIGVICLIVLPVMCRVIFGFILTWLENNSK